MESKSTADLKDILRAVLHPRGDQDAYEKNMRPVFAFMCFTEGCPIKCRTPFINSTNVAVAAQNKGMLPRLSRMGKATLQGKSLSTFIKPPEEVFICLTLAKYILHQLQERDVSTDEFRVGNPPELPVGPYRPKSNDAYDQNDINFFYSNLKKVHGIMMKDLKKKKELRWVYFNFEEPHSVDDANDSEGEQSQQEDTTTVAKNASSAPCFEYDDDDDDIELV